MPHDIKKKKDFRQYRQWSEGLTIVMQLGLTMAGSIVFCFFVGFYIDKWLGIKGVFTSIFIFLGVIGGGYTAYRQIMEIMENKNQRQNRDSP